MLPESYRNCYQSLRQLLQNFQAIAHSESPDPNTLQTEFVKIQEFFQQRVWALSLEGLDHQAVTQVRSLQTEINKQLRLLGTDVMFLRTARQFETKQQRLGQMGDRLRLLLAYCEALLD